MSDKDLITLSTLEDILFSIKLILKRFESIKSSSDFLEDDGLEKLDSISMRLIAIGEGFKKIDKLTNKELLSKYPTINWKGVKGVRDILSHHYFDMDAETIFKICNEDLHDLLKVTQDMINNIKTKELR